MAEIRYKGQIYSGVASVGDADDVNYDNTDSGLTATDVQGAVDEIVTKINNIVLIKERKTTTATFNNANYGVATVDVSKSGYTTLGIVGFQAAGNSVVYRVSAVGLSGTTVSMTVVNQTGSSETSTQTGWIDVLYVKN